MARTTNIAQTISVIAPDGAQVEFISPQEVTRSVTDRLPSGVIPLSQPNAADAGLHQGLAAEGFEILGEAQVRTPFGLARGGDGGVTLEAKVGSDESAVVLLEQGGVFHWVTDGARQPALATLARGGDPRTDVVRFTVTAGAGEAPVRRGLIGDLFEPVRALVLRFAAQAAVGEAVTLLERSVDAGLFPISDLEVAGWSPSKAPHRPTKPAKRVLLLVHGTFSSVIGTFGGMADLVWGRAFLSACLAQYDLVLGFNHRTLSQDPKANAEALLEALGEWDFGAEPPVIDIITHSRGGLVVRTLVEALAPGSALKARFGKAILVATTNNGTRLADPANWGRLADFYTTLVVAACRVLALVPQAKLGATILQEAITSLGALVKEIAAAGLDEKRVPGLAAMRPGQSFVNDLNATQPGQFGPAESIYLVIDASYAPNLDGAAASDLPARLVDLVKAGAVSQLMGTADNDLVVDTPSMTAIDAAAGDFVRDRVDFPHNPDIYHTNYFARPEVVSALTRWLGLRQPGEAGAALLPPLAADADVPAAVNTDILVVGGEEPAAAAARAIREAAPSFVVIRRKLDDGLHHYALGPDVADRLIISTDKVAGALDLHEYQSSEAAELETGVGAGLDAAPIGEGDLGPRRKVVLRRGVPVGVRPNLRELTAGGGLAGLAQGLNDGSDLSAVRWVMPSFEGGVGVPQPVVISPVLFQQSLGGSRAANDRGHPARRGASPGAGPIPTQPPPSQAGAVECQMQAEAPSQVRQGREFSVTVTISREAIAAAAEAAVSAAAIGQVRPDQPLVIEVVSKKGFQPVDGDEPERLMPPLPGLPAVRYFAMRAVEPGQGEIWVVVRQGRLPVATMKLAIQVAEAAGAPAATVRASAHGSAAGSIPPDHALRILEQTVNGKVQFRYELESAPCGLLKRYVSEPLEGDRGAFVAGLYKDIESRWTGTQTEAKAFESELQEIGADLWAQLLPDALRADLWDNRDRLSSILVVSEEPFIPWELLYMSDPRSPGLDPNGRFLCELGLTRWLYEAGAFPPAQINVGKGRFQCVRPTYPAGQTTFPPLPGAAAEVDAIKAAFGAVDAGTSAQALRALLSGGGGFDLLHFAGHGLAAQDAQGEPRLVVDGELVAGGYVPGYLGARAVSTRSNFGQARPGVFLNACRAGRPTVVLTGIGGFAQAFLAKRASLFVGALWSVGDDTAGAFAQAFYQALEDGGSLAVASQKARAAAKSADDPTWLAYAVYGHPNATATFA
ncbi:MAG TPA: CHAT domain-containing protein [Caulobacteraceae bacterium]